MHAPVLNIPIGITALRFLLTIVVAIDLSLEEYRAALILFAVAAFIDFLDGWAARRMKQETELGARLDPLADKFLMNSIFLIFAATKIMSWWLVVMVFSRDILILIGAGALMAFTSIREFPPSEWGKACTFAQIVVIVEYLASLAFPLVVSSYPFADSVISFTSLIAGMLIVISCFHYGWHGLLAYLGDRLKA